MHVPSRSVFNPYEFSLVNFATTGDTSSQMCPLLWKTIGLCELIPVKVLLVTCYGPSSNLKFFCMNFPVTKEDDLNSDTGITHQRVNLFSYDKHFYYIIFAAPYMIRTAQNYQCNSI